MNRSIHSLVALAAFAVTGSLAAEGRAQDNPSRSTTTTTTPGGPTSTTTTGVPGQSNTTVVVPPAQPPAPVQGIAEPMPESPPPPPMKETTRSEAVGPSWSMVGSGVIIFGLSYVPAVVVAGESNLDADRRLYVPLVGPWLDLGQRPACAANDCNAENTARVGLVIDGIFQGVGALTTIGGFLFMAHETRTVTTTAGEGTAPDLAPTLHLTPAKVGSGYGVGAVGTF
jgi:hypothetical protein